MTIEKVLAFIEHHGVKGQKWGVRNKRGDRSAFKPSPPHPTKHLSNDELRQVVDRMRLDQQFSQLSSAKTTKGHAFAKSILKDSGKAVVGAVVGAGATKLAKKIFPG